MIFIRCYKIYTYLHVSIFWSVLFGLFGFIGYIPNHIQILRFFKNHIHSVCMVYTKSKPYYLFGFGSVRYGSVLPYWTALLEIDSIRTCWLIVLIWIMKTLNLGIENPKTLKLEIDFKLFLLDWMIDDLSFKINRLIESRNLNLKALKPLTSCW